MVRESLLEGMQLPCSSKAFNGDDMPALNRNERIPTRIHGGVLISVKLCHASIGLMRPFTRSHRLWRSSARRKLENWLGQEVE
jgi:hypothetical protein